MLWIKKIAAIPFETVSYHKIYAHKPDYNDEYGGPKDNPFDIEIYFTELSDTIIIEARIINLLPEVDYIVKPYFSEYFEEMANFIGIELTDKDFRVIYTKDILEKRIQNIYSDMVLLIIGIGFFGGIIFLADVFSVSNENKLMSGLLILALGLLIMWFLVKVDKIKSLKNRIYSL